MYLTYCSNPCATNSANYHAGCGKTKELSRTNAQYWANQVPQLTVAFSKGPRWAQAEALEALDTPCCVCGERKLNADGTPAHKHGPGEVCL